MPYILQGTRDLLTYWNTLGRPCGREAMAAAIKTPKANLMAAGKDRVSFSTQYGEVEAQNIASVLGVEVSDVTDNAGQVLI